MNASAITFTRKDYNSSGIGLKINPVDNQIWTVNLSPVDRDMDLTRFMAIKAQKLLKKNFDSVTFFSPTSIYFYFTDEADEAAFILWASSDEISVDT